MTRISLRARRGLRTQHTVSHRTEADVQTVTIPAQSIEAYEDHIWAVNAAVEADQMDLAYELADHYLKA